MSAPTRKLFDVLRTEARNCYDYTPRKIAFPALGTKFIFSIVRSNVHKHREKIKYKPETHTHTHTHIVASYAKHFNTLIAKNDIPC
jgi:hypothetical protein